MNYGHLYFYSRVAKGGQVRAKIVISQTIQLQSVKLLILHTLKYAVSVITREEPKWEVSQYAIGGSARGRGGDGARRGSSRGGHRGDS